MHSFDGAFDKTAKLAEFDVIHRGIPLTQNRPQSLIPEREVQII